MASTADKDHDPFEAHRRPRIADREDEYLARRRAAVISPARIDPFENGGATPDINSRGYSQIMREQMLRRDQADLERQMRDKAKDGTLKVVQKQPAAAPQQQQQPRPGQRKRGRWDVASVASTPVQQGADQGQAGSGFDEDEPTTPAAKLRKQQQQLASGGGGAATPLTGEGAMGQNQWDATPGRRDGQADMTPGSGMTPAAARMWDPTPAPHQQQQQQQPHQTPGGGQATPAGGGRRNRWDETPRTERGETPGGGGQGLGWAETPRAGGGTAGAGGEKIIISETPTPSASKRRSRWDETPGATPSMGAGATPSGMGAGGGATPGGATPATAGGGGGATPMTPVTPAASSAASMATPMGPKAMGMATPSPAQLLQMTTEQLQAYRWEKEIDERNRPLGDEELDAMFPPGYKVLQPPAGYVPVRTPGRRLMATPTPMVGQTPTGFYMQPDTPGVGGDRAGRMGIMDMQPKGSGSGSGANLPFLKPEDAQYFDKLLVDVDESSLSAEELKERKIMELLLKIKNGTPPMRKASLRRITDKAREFGAGPLFNQILPLLMSPTLEDQERHMLVKVMT